MAVLDFASGFSWMSALSVAPLRPLHTWVRTAEDRFRPRRVVPYLPRGARGEALVAGDSRELPSDRAEIFRENGTGRTPTVVLGGLLPDATEQVFLLRRFLQRSGDVYYVNYPRAGFSLDVVCAQLADLCGELAALGEPPVVFAVSFGAGIVLEWLRRERAIGHAPVLAGLVLVSPVTCVADIIAPDAPRPSTLIGCALQPFLEPGATVPEAAVEKSRAIFLRMFEAGAQNKLALRMLMTEREAERLRAAVMGTIRGVTAAGARLRVQALGRMRAPTEYFSPKALPLSTAPVLVLFAEREDAVLDSDAPVRFALERASRAYFPHAHVQRVCARAGQTPVQHASLIFHVFDFLPPFHAFYQRVRRSNLAIAA